MPRDATKRAAGGIEDSVPDRREEPLTQPLQSAKPICGSAERQVSLRAHLLSRAEHLDCSLAQDARCPNNGAPLARRLAI